MRDTVPAPQGSSAQAKVDLADRLARRGRFVLLRKLGEGGMGEVFAAYDEQLDRRVAIKLLHSDYTSDEGRLRLVREAQALARVAHPNVVTVFEVGQLDGDVFLAMEFVDGVTLREWQEMEGRTTADILSAYLEAGKGLAAVHAAGLVHRDFKPTNVMVGPDERVRILDFGLAHGRSAKNEAKLSDQVQSATLDSKLTMTGAVVGTPAYMSAEQYLGEQVDARSDQFSFCVALYEAAYKKHPFGGQTMHDLLPRLLEGKPLPPSAGEQVPARVTAAIMRGLERSPENRFADMNALLEALMGEVAADPAEHSRQRLIYGTILVLAAGVQVVRQVVTERSALHSTRELLTISLVGLLVVSLGLLLFRKSLLRNVFHRRMAGASVIALVVLSVSRGIGVFQNEPGIAVIVRDLLILCSISAAVGIFLTAFTRWVWFNPVLPLVTIVCIFSWPAHREFFCIAGLNASLLGFIFVWDKLSRMSRNIPAINPATPAVSSARIFGKGSR